MNYIATFQISCIEVPLDQPTYRLEIAVPLVMGRGCFCINNKTPKPIVFEVPLDGSIMYIDQWITDKYLDKPFCGVDRALDSVRLAGVQHKGDKWSLADMCALCSREGFAPDAIIKDKDAYWFLTSRSWAWITKEGICVALVCDAPCYNGKLTLVR